jgi:hypothetical protein
MNKELMMLPICGAHSRTTGKPCQNVAGKGTDHLGQGRCRYHGGATPIKHGLYSKVRRGRLGQRIAEIASRTDLLDLNEELALLKALLQQWLLEHQSLVDGIRSWHRSTSPAFKILLQSNDASEIREAIVALRAAETSRPGQLPAVDIITMLTDKIGHTAERIAKMSTVCTRGQVQRILDRMGTIVAEHVDEQTGQKIIQGWANIELEQR